MHYCIPGARLCKAEELYKPKICRECRLLLSQIHPTLRISSTFSNTISNSVEYVLNCLGSQYYVVCDVSMRACTALGCSTRCTVFAAEGASRHAPHLLWPCSLFPGPVQSCAEPPLVGVNRTYAYNITAVNRRLSMCNLAVFLMQFRYTSGKMAVDSNVIASRWTAA